MLMRLETLARLAFWCCACGVLYTYAVYPALIWLMARLFGEHKPPTELADEKLPLVTLLIAAHNEESVIGPRIENALTLHYPTEKLDILIASDGSEDSTAAIVQRYAARGVRLLDYPVRRGKAAVLCAAIKEARGGIVVLSDANTKTNADAIRSLVRWFADPQVGVVCGRLILADPHTGKNVDGAYWRYETFLKRHESQLGALLGSNGAIYAIRADRFQPIPPGTIVDDFVIPLLARLRTGCRIVYDPSTVAEEDSAPDIRGEFRRRVRIGAGDWQSIRILWPLLNPLQGWVAFTFFSHKVLRWLGPFFLLAALTLNFVLLDSKLGVYSLEAQLIGYCLAILGGGVPKGAPAWKLMRLANLFVNMNVALLVGFFRFVSGSQSGAWSRTQRAAESANNGAVTVETGK